jgi:thiazole tautomerase (transcriptional regulator TenI)
MKKQLHVITDGKLSKVEFLEIAKVIEPYVDKFHIREKQKTAKDLYDFVSYLLNVGISSNKLIINDRMDVACSLQTGVQLAYHSLPIEIVKQSFPSIHAGCSIHSIEEAVQAERNGADFLLYGHVFETNSKKGMVPRGLRELAFIKKSVNIPVLAIGGIKPENVGRVLETNIDGIAVMSGIIQAENPLQIVKRYAEHLHMGSGV